MATSTRGQRKVARSSSDAVSRQLSLFISLSTVLTGTPTVDPAVARRHLQTLNASASPGDVKALLQAYQVIVKSGEEIARKVAGLLGDQTPAARAGRNLLTLWFTGLITLKDGTRHYAHSEDYFDALMWNAAGAHPPASSDGYFGHWSLPPDSGH